MNIAYITTEFITEKKYGGLATYLYNIAIIMSQRGHKVTIFTLSEKNEIIQFANNIKVIRVKGRKIRPQIDKMGRAADMLSNSFLLNQKVKKENKIEKFDIVQATNYQAAGIFRIYSLPYIVRLSSDSSLLRNASKANFNLAQALIEKKLEDYLELLCIKLCDASFAPSYFCANSVMKRIHKKIDVIESPFMPKKIDINESLYEKFLYNKKYILFNSSLSYLKGTHIGIKATEKLLSRNPNLYMVYVGHDYGFIDENGGNKSVADILKRQHLKYEGRVLYFKNVRKDILYSLIMHSYACVLPSRVDNLPNSCIEAMSVGKIVIGTYGASFEQLIENKKSGLLIKRDSVNALVNAVEYVLNLSEKERKKIEMEAKKAIERLNPDNAYRNTIEYYQNIIIKQKRFN